MLGTKSKSKIANDIECYIGYIKYVKLLSANLVLVCNRQHKQKKTSKIDNYRETGIYYRLNWAFNEALIDSPLFHIKIDNVKAKM